MKFVDLNLKNLFLYLVMNREQWLNGVKKPPYVVTDEKKHKLREVVMLAIGGASMCWDPRPSTAVFDSEEAGRIGEELISFIEKEL